MNMILKKQNKPNERTLIETLAVLGSVVILSFLFPQQKGLFGLIPIVYLLIERRLKKKTFEEIGFKFRHSLKDVKDNWFLVLLVAVVLQLAAILIAKELLPDFITHVQSRIPMFNLKELIPLFIIITIGTFAEEIVYRGFFQEGLGRFFGTIIAIIIPSIVFSFMHYSQGSSIVVIFDIFTIFLDSIVYGMIYHRTKNIVASWIAHYCSDIFALIVMVLVFR